jgi:hypothetical protein
MLAIAQRLVVPAVVSIFVLAWSSVLAGQAGNDSKPAVHIDLKFSVPELDPNDPKDSFIACVIRNNSDKAIKVPAGYVPGYDRDMILKADAPNFGWGLWLVRWRGDAKPPHVLLEPGQQLSVFKASLKELLFPEKSKQVRWTWEA